MTALVSIPSRIPMLIRLLASDSDGEVVAAARALRRTLCGAGLDMNDLADCLEIPSQQSPANRPCMWSRMTSQHRVQFLEMALRGDVFSRWEREFAQSVREQLRAGRRLSPKQDAICQRLYSTWMA
jgi:hypothetical protein